MDENVFHSLVCVEERDHVYSVALLFANQIDKLELNENDIVTSKIRGIN